jgi:hypothetical protein
MTPDEAASVCRLLVKRNGVLSIVKTKGAAPIRVWNTRREREYGGFTSLTANVSPPVDQDGQPAPVRDSLIIFDPWEIVEISDEWGNVLYRQIVLP